jgi:hypothetical protein
MSRPTTVVSRLRRSVTERIAARGRLLTGDATAVRPDRADRDLESAPESLVASSARLRLDADAKHNPKTLRDYLAEHPDRVINVVESP